MAEDTLYLISLSCNIRTVKSAVKETKGLTKYFHPFADIVTDKTCGRSTCTEYLLLS